MSKTLPFQTIQFSINGFSSVSLFKSILTFVVFLMLKPSVWKNSCDTTQPIVGSIFIIRVFIPFPWYLSENERNSLTGERTHHDSAVQRSNHTPRVYPLA